jgi:hypothetical protein
MVFNVVVNNRATFATPQARAGARNYPYDLSAAAALGNRIANLKFGDSLCHENKKSPSALMTDGLLTSL